MQAMNTNEKRIRVDRVFKMRLTQTLDFLRVNYDDMTAGQREFFDKMLEGGTDNISEHQAQMLNNMAANLKGSRTLIVRSKY